MDYLKDNRQSAVMKMLNEDYDEVMEYNQRYFEEVGFERGLERVAARLRADGIDEAYVSEVLSAAREG